MDVKRLRGPWLGLVTRTTWMPSISRRSSPRVTVSAGKSSVETASGIGCATLTSTDSSALFRRRRMCSRAPLPVVAGQCAVLVNRAAA
jgi:hypothetical protein